MQILRSINLQMRNLLHLIKKHKKQMDLHETLPLKRYEQINLHR